MNNYAIISDTTCDLNEELRKRFKMDGYMYSHITLPGGKELAAKLDWDFMNKADFYTSLKARPNDYHTAPPSAEEMVSYMGEILKNGKDVLAISLSSGISVSYNIMLNAKKILQEKYPERKICVVDSKKYSAALGLLIIKACELRDKGLSIEDNAKTLDSIKYSMHQMGTLDDLSFVAAKGRISKSKAFMGTLIGIKPLGELGPEGMTTVLAKVKGYDKVYKATIEYIKKTIVEPEKQIILVANTMRESQAKILTELIKEQIKPKEVIIIEAYAPSGINMGPGLVAAYYFGKPITDLKAETEILKSITDKL